MNCNYCKQTYNKKYYKTHLKTKKHLKNQNEDNKLFKEGLKLLCKENENIIKDYIKDLENVEEYKCELCKKTYEDNLETVESSHHGKYIVQCMNCEKCFCLECLEDHDKFNDELDDYHGDIEWCLSHDELCRNCYEKDKIRDEIIDDNRYKNRKMINIMVKKGVIEENDYDSDLGIYPSEDEYEFKEWNNNWNEELKNYDSDDYDY